jgi:hypothetical protein
MLNSRKSSLKLFQEWGGGGWKGGDKGEWWRGEFKHDISDTL